MQRTALPYTKLSRRIAATLALAPLLLLLLGGCGPAARGGEASGLMRAVTTIAQIGDAVRVVGGEHVEVIALMGAGVDPHLYKASEGDVIDLIDADIIFYNGLHLEGKMGEVLERIAEDRPVVAVSDAIPRERLRQPPEFAGNYDPHVWFDAGLWRYAVEAVRDGLIAYDPIHAAAYQSNAAAYLMELEALDIATREQIATIPADRRVLVTAHDAFGYFGAAYGIEVVGLQGISTETESGIGDVRRVAALIAARGVKAMFVETSVSPRTVEAVQAAVRDRGGEVRIGGQIYSDAMGDEGTLEGTYVGMFEANVGTIVGALR